jgi:YihY family inner membrane protein
VPGGPGAVERIVMHTIHEGRESGLLFVLPLLWTGTLVFNAVTKALNVAFETEERYTFWKRTLVRLLMLLTLGGMFLFAMAASPVLRIVHSKIGILPGGREVFFPVIVTVLPALFLLIAFFLAYRFVPQRRPHWRAAWWGAGVAALLFAAAKPLFLGYVREMAR